MKNGVIISCGQGQQILLQRSKEQDTILLSICDLAKGKVSSIELDETQWRDLTDGTRGNPDLELIIQHTQETLQFVPAKPDTADDDDDDDDDDDFMPAADAFDGTEADDEEDQLTDSP